MPPECFEVDAADGEIKTIFGDASSVKGKAMVAQPSYDIWSLGCILYQLSNDDFRQLFRGNQRDRLSSQKFHLDDGGRILAEDSNSLWALYDWNDERKAAKLSRVKDPMARHLLGMMLHWSPHLRPSVDEILSHPYITGEDASSIDTKYPSIRDAASRSHSEKAVGGRMGSISEHGDPRTPANALTMSMSPRQGTSARVDVHRHLQLAKEGENTELRGELEQTRQRESALLEEVDKLRMELGKYVMVEMMAGAGAGTSLTAIDEVIAIAQPGGTKWDASKA
jgi:serine/threonine protein kinase